MGSANTFTVVTPNYNMGQYLARTIESVIRNLRSGDRYFVIDGCSTDGSVEIIWPYEEHLISGDTAVRLNERTNR